MTTQSTGPNDDLFEGFPPAIGRWPTEEAVRRLREVGAAQQADDLEHSVARAHAEAMGGAWDWLTSLRRTPAWKHATHRVGFLDSVPEGAVQAIDIKDAGTIAPDADLRGQRVTLSLMALRVWSYPGRGTHNVLLNFGARNQAPDGTETVAFNLSARVPDGEEAGILNYPIFIGLKLGNEGVVFEGRTVNVNNVEDKSVLDVLDSELFRDGLKLLETAQPVIKPFTALGVGLARAMAKRHENIPVQEFKIGLDCSPGIAMSVRLRAGVYLIAQVPQATPGKHGLDWNDWVYLPSQHTIVRRTDRGEPLPVNFVAIGIRRSAE
jgi:hypothetical protein